MRSIKLAGVLLTLALAAIASAGAGSASATALCEVTGAVCPEGKPYADGTELKAKLPLGAKAKLTTNLGTLECEESTWKGKSAADQNGELTGGKITELIFNTCAVPLPAPLCPGGVVATGLSYGMSTEATTAGNGFFYFFGGPPRLLVKCGAIECTFTFSNLPLEVTGGATAIAKINTSPIEMAGAKCPKTATLTAEYEITMPKPLFIAAEVAPPVLCEEFKSPCPAGKVVGVGRTIEAQLGANVKFSYLFNGTKKEPSCTSSKIAGKITAEGRPVVGELTKWEFPGGCGGGLCETTAQHLPYRLEFERTSGGNGTLEWLSKASGGPSVKLKCGVLEECIYGASSFEFKFEGSAIAPRFYRTTSIGLVRESGSSLLCSETATLEGTASAEIKFKVTAPAELFMTS